MTNGITENCLSIEPLACKIVDETFASVDAMPVPSDLDIICFLLFFYLFDMTIYVFFMAAPL